MSTIAQVSSVSNITFQSATAREHPTELLNNKESQAETSSFLQDDTVNVSEEARQRQNAEHSETSNGAQNGNNALSEEEKKQVQELNQRDREVRTHEAAHKAAAGQYAKGSPTYEYQRGPDGKNYAVGGEVQIDTSTVRGDPEATLQKASRIQAAATAPADPSSQDRAVAAQAAAMAANAQAEMAESRSSDGSNGGNQSDNNNTDEATESQQTNRQAGAASYQQISQLPEQTNFASALHLVA